MCLFPVSVWSIQDPVAGTDEGILHKTGGIIQNEKSNNDCQFRKAFILLFSNSSRTKGSSPSLLTSLPALAQCSLGLLRNLSLISNSTLSSCCCCCCCSFSVLQGVPHCRGEDDDMGRLGLGVPEAVLAGARKTALERQCSPAKLTGAAFEKPFVTLFRISF